VSPATRTALGGRYHLDSRIATGGMGEVWHAIDAVLGRTVAVKVLRREYAGDETFLERFRAEARSMALLAHPGIAQVFDFGETPIGGVSVPFIVMELVPGQPLSAIVGRGRSIDPDRALDIVEQAAHALHAAHEAGVVHRDVKPANLLVTPAGVVKVTDFGIARAADALPLTRSGTVMGTAHYIAPELAGSTGKASAASDMYALGVVLYECVAGQRPFPGDNPVNVALAHVQDEPPELPARVPDPVRRLVKRVLAKDPINRPPTASDFARRCAAVRRELTGPPDAAQPVAPPADWRAGPAATASYDPPVTPSGGVGLAVADPQVTRALPDVAVTSTARVAGGRAAARRAARQSAASRRPSRQLAAAIVLVLVVGVLGGWLLVRGGERVVVAPEVVGDTQRQAVARLKAAGFTPDVRGQVNPNVREGVVFEQSVSPGRELPSGSVVVVLVSTGPPTVLVRAAEWRGRPYDEVANELGRRGLVVRREYATVSGAAGTVADVAPEGAVPVGGTVTVIVVRAPSAENVPRDDAVGDDRDDRKGKNGKGKGAGKGGGEGRDKGEDD